MDVSEWDPLIRAYLAAKTERERSDRLATLIDSVGRPTKAIVERKIGSNGRRSPVEMEDLTAEIRVQLIQALRKIEADPNSTPIRHFHSWAKQIADNHVNAYLRRKYPNRRSVDDRLRYLFERCATPSRLALWRSPEGERIAGFDTWRNRRLPAASARLQKMLEEPTRALHEAVYSRERGAVNPIAQLEALFDWIGHPVAFDHLVQIMAEVWNRRDMPDYSLDAGHSEASVDSHPPVTIVLAFDLRRLWELIRALSHHERSALLLQARDHHGNALIELLVLHGVATFDAVADALGLHPDELGALWNDLPLDDMRIARRLNVSVERITSLRYSARRRLDKQVRSEELVP